MEILQERTQQQKPDTSFEAQQHNARIAERYARLQNLRNAQQEQCQETETVQANTVTVDPVRPVFYGAAYGCGNTRDAANAANHGIFARSG